MVEQHIVWIEFPVGLDSIFIDILLSSNWFEIV